MKKIKKLPNHDNYNYVCLFESPDTDCGDIVVKVRNYQCSLEYKESQDAVIRVYDDYREVLELIDDGNGIKTELGEYLDYSQWTYLTCALRAYDVNYKFSKKMKVIDL